MPWRTTNAPTAFPVRLRSELPLDDAIKQLQDAGVKVCRVVNKPVYTDENLPDCVSCGDLRNAIAMTQKTFVVDTDYSVPADRLRTIAEMINACLR
jgi:hypothetical protein